MIGLFTFCLDINKIETKILHLACDNLIKSLDKSTLKYNLVIYTNFNLLIKHPNVIIRKYNHIYEFENIINYYGKRWSVEWSTKWYQLSFNKIFYWKMLYNEFNNNFTWIDLDTIVLSDLSYLENYENFFISNGGNKKSKNPLLCYLDNQRVSNDNITVIKKNYINGSLWKLNLNLYNNLIKEYLTLVSKKLLPRQDTQDLFNYFIYIINENDINKFNIAGVNIKHNSIYGLSLWENDSEDVSHHNSNIKLEYKNNKFMLNNQNIEIISFTFLNYMKTLKTNIFFDINEYIDVNNDLFKKTTLFTNLYNCDEYIDRYIHCINNLKYFTYNKLILLNVCDTNSDATNQKINELKNKYNNITLLNFKKDDNIGLYEGWNIMIEHIDTELCCNFNVDDYLSSDFFIKIFKEFLNNDIDMICSEIYVFEQNDLLFLDNKKLKKLYEYKKLFVTEKDYIYLKDNNLIDDFNNIINDDDDNIDKKIYGINYKLDVINNHSENAVILNTRNKDVDIFSFLNFKTKINDLNSYWPRSFPGIAPIWKKNLFNRLGKFKNTYYLNEIIYSSDYEFWLRCFKYGANIKILNEPLSYYYRNKNSRSQDLFKDKNYIEKNKKNNLKIIYEYLKSYDLNFINNQKLTQNDFCIDNNNLISIIKKYNINQINISKGLDENTKNICKSYNLRTNNYKINDPILFMGLYRQNDVKLCLNHKGLKIIWWHNNDCNIKYRIRKEILINVNSLSNVRHIYTNSNVKKYLDELNINSEFVKL